MTKTRITFAVAFFAATIALGAAATAAIQFAPQSSGPNAPASFALFVANQPASSGRVGIFVARRQNGVGSLYYCSSPVDANSADPNGCKQIKGFPTK